MIRDGDPAPAVSLDAAADATRSLAIERLETLLRGAELGREQRAELLFRLAELTWEQGRAAHLRAVEEATRDFDACQATGADCVFREPSREWLDRPLGIYARLVDDYADYARIDEVTWAYGRTLLEAGRGAEANVQLTGLVKRWPASAYATDAYVLIGEHWFEGGEPFKAAAAYRRAAADRAHPKSAFARYKLAWCLYNLGEPATALEELRGVLADTVGADEAGRISLRDEALGDVVRFAADAGEPTVVPLLAGRARADDVRAAEARLADRYLELGKRDRATTAWRGLLAAYPEDPAAPRWAEGVARAHLDAGALADALVEVERLDARYGAGSAWARVNAARPEAVAAVGERVEALLAGLATRAHREAKATPALLDVAERAYTLALARFPEGPNAYDLRYGLAELSYRKKAYDRAYELYVSVVEADPAGRHARFCAESAIFAARELAKAERVAPTGRAPVPLGPWEAREIAAIERYLGLTGGQSADANELRFEVASILQGKNHLREASERFRAIVEADPASPLAERAAAGVLDGLELAEEWDALADTALLLARSPEIGTAAFRREAQTIGERARLAAVARRVADGGDRAAAAAELLAFVDAFPRSSFADLALNDAAAHLDGRDARGALAARERLVAGFPKSRFRPAAIAALGFGYESLADFGRAAEWYERLAAEHPDHPGAPAALWSAGLFRATRGEWEAAVADWRRYTTSWPDRPDAPGVALQVGPLLADNGRPAEAAALYRRFFEAPPAGATVDQVLFARLGYGELLETIGQGARARDHWAASLAFADRAEAAGPLPPAAPEYVARMRVAVAEPAFRAFLAQRIDGAGAVGRAGLDAALERQLVAKARALQMLEATYADVLRPGVGPTGYVALAKLGEAYEDFAATLRASPVPAYLTEEQAWLYRQRLDDLAYAQDERAATAYRTLLTRASELDAFDATTEAVALRLATLRPEAGTGRPERVPEPRFLASAVAMGFEE